jgi:hypothetical protein
MNADAGNSVTYERSRPSELPAELRASHEEPTTFDPTYVGLTKTLPERTALLCVTADHQRRLFKLYWFFAERSDESVQVTSKHNHLRRRRWPKYSGRKSGVTATTASWIAGRA